MRSLRPWLVVTCFAVMAGLGNACGGGGGDADRERAKTEAGALPSDDATTGFGDDDGSIVDSRRSDAGSNGPDVNGPLAIAPTDDVDRHHLRTGRARRCSSRRPSTATRARVVRDRPRRDREHRRGDRRALAVGRHRRQGQRLGDVRQPARDDDGHGPHSLLAERRRRARRRGRRAARATPATHGDAGVRTRAATGGVGGEGVGRPGRSRDAGAAPGGARRGAVEAGAGAPAGSIRTTRPSGRAGCSRRSSSGAPRRRSMPSSFT